LPSNHKIIGQTAGGVKMVLPVRLGRERLEGKKGFQGKETAGVVPLGQQFKISNIFG
jgi:hypothetical protein